MIKKLLKKLLFWFVAYLVSACLFITISFAQDVSIKQFQIDGNFRIANESVIAYSGFELGDELSDFNVNIALKSLYDTGLFSDIKIGFDKGTLEIILKENPSINLITFEGNKIFTESDLVDMIVLQQKSIYSISKVKSDTSALVESYRERGHFNASIEPKLILLEENRINLIFEINEGVPSYIRKINFIGNSFFSDRDLRDSIATSEKKWWKFLSATTKYNSDLVNYDTSLIQDLYKNKGFINSKVVSAVAELSKDYKDFFLTFSIDEGSQYKFGESVISADIDIDLDELYDQIETVDGNIYRADLVKRTIGNLTYAVASFGYAFSDIRADIITNDDTSTVKVIYNIIKGPRIYVEKINIIGNSSTIDKVIRREIEIAEGDPYNRNLIEKSKDNLNSLRYFANLDVVANPGSEEDLTVINVKVEEKTTGSASVGAGYGSVEGLNTQFGIQETNFLGRGQQVTLNTSLSTEAQKFTLSFLEPYYKNRNLGFGLDIYSDVINYDTFTYGLKRVGGQTKLVYNLSEFTKFSPKISVARERITAENNASDFINSQKGTKTISKIGYTIFYDRRNRTFRPTEGFSIKFDDWYGVGNVNTWKHEIKSQLYHTFAPSYIGRVSFDIGGVHSVGADDVRVSDNFVLGGMGSLRGFGGTGPRDANNVLIGGKYYTHFSTELDAPLLPEKTAISSILFVDIGNVWALDANVGTDSSKYWRVSSGVNLGWESPIGPFNFVFAVPVRKYSSDTTDFFSWSIGYIF